MAQPTGAPPAPLLDVRSIVRTYKAPRGGTPTRALDGLSLRVQPGEWVALLGPNGSGKSTLVRILATLERPDSGEVLAFGDPLAGAALADYRRRLAVVFQNPGLDKLLTVRENLASQAALHGISRAARDAAITRVARELQIDDRLDDRVSRLSGGLARRCDLARALLPGPSLLILDEATSGLDYDSRTGFMSLLGSLRRAGGAHALTILMTTHLMDEAELADRVVMVHRGRVVLEGPSAELREGVGGVTIRCPVASGAAERILSDAGLASHPHGGSRVARVDASRAASLLPAVAAKLAEAGVAFEVSPPTLGDVYLGATGSQLAELEDRGEAA